MTLVVYKSKKEKRQGANSPEDSTADYNAYFTELDRSKHGKLSSMLELASMAVQTKVYPSSHCQKILLYVVV